MDNLGKDQLYSVLNEPTMENFRYLLQNHMGEENYLDFKAKWIEKEKEARHILAMANNGGGCIIFGVSQNEDGTVEPTGLDKFKDTADLKKEIFGYIPENLFYELKDFSYDSSEYEKMKGKKFQILIIKDEPCNLPYICCKDGKELCDGDIFVRKGTESVKASNYDLEKIIERKINALKIPRKNNMDLSQHLEQLKVLYNQLTYTKSNGAFSGFGSVIAKLLGDTTVVKKDCFPKEEYDEFVVRMLDKKKKRIEEELDL